MTDSTVEYLKQFPKLTDEDKRLIREYFNRQSDGAPFGPASRDIRKEVERAVKAALDPSVLGITITAQNIDTYTSLVFYALDNAGLLVKE